jgi:hypothetical protein
VLNGKRIKFVKLWIFKEIGSQDWGGLLMVLLDRYRVIDSLGSQLLFILKLSSYLVFKNVSLGGITFQPPGGHEVRGATALAVVFRVFAGGYYCAL